jgi:hypothetical protein
MVKLQENKGKYSINIPNEYIRRKKWVKGQELLFSFDQDGNLLIMPVDHDGK